MQIVLLAAGDGTRYREYSDVPKPHILVHDKPMWQHAMQPWLKYGTPHIVVRTQHKEHFKLPDYDIGVTWVNRLTEGAAETAYIACDNLNEDEPVCFIDSDGYIEFSNWNPEGIGGTFVTYGDKPVHSFVKTDENGYITEVREKQVISNTANTGHYWWPSVRVFRETFEEAIAINLRTKNEYYMAPMYNIAIQAGHKFKTHMVDKWVCWGTPDDLLRNYEGKADI